MNNINTDELEELTDFFKVFADYTRLRILQTLVDGSLCVSDIAEKLGMEQSAISHQLRVIKQMKLVKATREGKQMVYSLADDHILTIITMGLEHVREED